MSFSKIQANKEISKPIENEPSVIEIVYSMDWSATELGPMESWPDSIKSLVTFCLRSVCPHAIYLGTQHLLIYNQYCVPLLQNKHPHALGSPASEVWAETWDVVESIFTGVTLTGKGQYHEDLLLYISRAGYNEESYMSFAFSPIFAEDKTVIGIFAAVHETTERVISARRLKTLGELGKGTHGAKSVESSCHLVTKILRDHVADIPYALIYLVEENKQTDKKCQGYVARLAATTFDENLLAQTGKDGVEEVTFVTGLSKRILPDYLLNSPDSEEISTDKDNTFSPSLSSSSNLTTWPLEEVIKTNKHVVVELANESRAILLPVSTSFAGKGILTAILICGINSHRALDKEYLEFFKLVVGHFSSSLKNGLSREEERKKAKILADLNLQKIRFFQNISHELKTPLTLMLAPLEDAIATCEPDSSILFNLEMIQRNARRLLKLVNTLLEFSRIEAGHVKAYYCETKIAGLTRELVLNFQSMARSFGLTLIIDIPVDEVLESQLECEVYLDLDLYEKIIFNLCLNAFKHTWDGAVTIRLSPGKRESREVVFIEVSDTGVGIPKEELPNIFQRFYRVQSKQARSHEGTGIGLALVKELVNRHGGDIKVTSQVGVGSTFQIWIPTGTDHLPKKNIISGLSSWDNRSSKNIDLYLDESREWIKSKNDSNDFHTKFEDDENPTTLGHLQTLSIASPRLDSKKRSSLDKEKGSKDPKGRFKVLIVEDNADMRDYLINILKPEFEIFCACDGLHALRIINNVEFKPNLVLSDVMMPNMNGIELLKILRSDPSTQSIPFILLSARAGEEASLEGLRKGADDYLIKPFNSRELIARVRANINISNLYHEILDQQRGESETQQLLFSISNKIRSELSIQELLSTAVEQVFRILSCDSIFVLFNDPMNKGSAKIMAVSANDPDIKALVGTQVSCKAVDNSQDILGGQLDGLPEIDSTTHLLSSFLASFTEAPPDPSAPIKSKSDTENSFFDFEVKSHTNHFSRILNQAVSSMSVSIHLDSGSCGWIFAHRKPKETWSSSEKTFLQQISNQISLAITHSRLLEEKIKSEAQMEAAEAANKAKSQILANTSHELRTPLGAIIGILSAFEDTLFTADQKDMVQIMAHASDVVLAIVNDILDAAKLEAHKITLNNRTFDLFDLVEKTVEIFGESAGAKHIELVLLCERSNELPKYVKSDPERLQQILINLLSNSVKFTKSGEIVLKISLASSRDTEIKTGGSNSKQTNLTNVVLLFELNDTGIGIDPTFIKDIWKSFSRGDSSITRSQDGTGLGLSICKNLVTINGGNIGVRSELGKGSHFWFTWNVEFLALDGTSSTSSTQMTPIERILVIPPIVKSKKIFIVDSVEASRSAMVTMLSSSVQKVEAFEDGSKAVIATKALRDQYHCSPCDVVFFNVDEKNADQVLTTAKEFQSICGKDRLAIGLFVFRSLEGYALGKELTRKIGGHTATYCKPIMQRRLLDSLQNMDMLNSAKMDETNPQAELSLGQFRVKEVEKMQETTDVSLAHLPFEKIPKTRLKSIIPRPPRKRSASSEIKNPTHSEPSNKSRTRVVSKSKCILCVEDNPINLKVLQHQLKALGYQSICATNGQEAVNILQRELGASIDSAEVLNQQNRVSLILMDCAMPIMSGYAASKAIRAMAPPQSEIPIIALTASAIEGTRDKCLKNGMNDYLTKPLKIPQLKDMLLRWLGDS